MAGRNYVKAVREGARNRGTKRLHRVPVRLPYGDVERVSWVMVDKLMALKRERTRSVVGRVSRQELAGVEIAMKDLLGLTMVQ